MSPDVLVIARINGGQRPDRDFNRVGCDIVTARRHGKMAAVVLGFSSSDATFVAAAISELARSIIFFAQRGDHLNAVRHRDQGTSSA